MPQPVFYDRNVVGGRASPSVCTQLIPLRHVFLPVENLLRPHFEEEVFQVIGCDGPVDVVVDDLAGIRDVNLPRPERP